MNDTEPAYLALLDQIRSTRAPEDRRDLLWWTFDQIAQSGLSGGELTVVNAVRAMRTIDDQWPWVDATWRAGFAAALDDLAQRIRDGVA